MPYIHIIPAMRTSQRLALAIVRLIRKQARIRHHVIVDITVNGYDEWAIRVSCDNENGELALIKKILDDNAHMLASVDIDNSYW